MEEKNKLEAGKVDFFRDRVENPNTHSSYNRYLNDFFVYFKKIDQKRGEAYIQKLRAEGYSPATLNNAACALRKFADIHNIPLKIKNVPKIEHSLPKIISQEENEQLLSFIIDLRDRTVVSLLYDAGLRVGELVALNNGEIDETNRTVFIARRKGGLPQVLPFGERTGENIHEYQSEKVNQGIIRSKTDPFIIGNGGRISKSGAP